MKFIEKSSHHRFNWIDRVWRQDLCNWFDIKIQLTRRKCESKGVSRISIELNSKSMAVISMLIWTLLWIWNSERFKIPSATQQNPFQRNFLTVFPQKIITSSNAKLEFDPRTIWHTVYKLSKWCWIHIDSYHDKVITQNWNMAFGKSIHPPRHAQSPKTMLLCFRYSR